MAQWRGSTTNARSSERHSTGWLIWPLTPSCYYGGINWSLSLYYYSSHSFAWKSLSWSPISYRNAMDTLPSWAQTSGAPSSSNIRWIANQEGTFQREWASTVNSFTSCASCLGSSTWDARTSCGFTCSWAWCRWAWPMFGCTMAIQWIYWKGGMSNSMESSRLKLNS
jgi:hypothetical protein